MRPEELIATLIARDEWWVVNRDALLESLRSAHDHIIHLEAELRVIAITNAYESCFGTPFCSRHANQHDDRCAIAVALRTLAP